MARDYVLEFCNRVRARLDLPPVDAIVDGIPRNAMMCPIAMTITQGNVRLNPVVVVAGYHVSWYDAELDEYKVIRGENPPTVRKFIRSVDRSTFYGV